MLEQERKNKMSEQQDSANPELIKFILEARRRGFEDWQIREPLIRHGWNENEVESAFYEIKKQEDRNLKKKQTKDNKTIYVYKNSLTIHLDSEILKIIEKRAKKNMLTPKEQVEDIIRRSCASIKKTAGVEDNVDDLFLKLFSRKRSGRPRTGTKL